MVGEWSAGASDHPYFFLSYRRSEYQPGDGSDPDIWVKKFYQDLCNDLHQLTSARVPGYMDVQTPLGHVWPDELAEALCGCKVFVPLLTPGYFDSEWCGKEWVAFTQRMQMHAAAEGNAPAAILPVLWAPFRRYVLPSAVSDMQLVPPGFPKAYEDQGFFGLIKLKRFSVAYTRSVLRMAQTIQQVAEETNLAACSVMAMDSLQNAFADHQVRNATHQIRLAVAACLMSTTDASRGQPARARSNYYYGHTMCEWMPYRGPQDTTLIARYAERIISNLGHRAVLDPLDDPVEVPRSPSVMLVDPWAPGVPEIADNLRTRDADPTHVVVPWNQDDEETTRETPHLQANLQGTLPRSLKVFPGRLHMCRRLKLSALHCRKQ